MKDDGELRDLTSFLLEWQDTCAIDKCPRVKTKICDNGVEVPLRVDGELVYECKFKNEGESNEDYVARIKADVAYVHRAADCRFKMLIQSPRSPGKFRATEREDEAKDNGDSILASERENGGNDNVGEQPCSCDLEQARPPSKLSPAMHVPEGMALSESAFIPDDKKQDAEEPSSSQAVAIRGRMVSEYIDLVRQWNSDASSQTHAFHLLELFLYAKAQISGRPFKSHLFDVIAIQGGLGNVWGYLYKRVLTSVANGSFRTITGVDEDIAASPRSTGIEGPEVDLVEVREATEFLEKWIDGHWPDFTLNDKLALLCTILEISMNAPEILEKVTVGRQAFYNRKRLARDAFGYLRENGCSNAAMAKTLAGPFQSILLRQAADDVECQWFVAYFNEKRKVAGK